MSECWFCRRTFEHKEVGFVLDGWPCCHGCYRKADDPDMLFERARQLFEHGRDPTMLKRKHLMSSFTRYAEMGLTHVRVSARGCCPECEALDGLVQPIAQVTKANPIPQTCCTREIDRTSPESLAYPWCICMYEPVFPED